MTIDEALDEFARRGSTPAVTPRTAYGARCGCCAFQLEREGVPGDAALERLTPDAPRRAFVTWHARAGMADDADGTRKVALHVARLGAYLAARWGRPDLDVGRERLRLLPDRPAGA